jgi:surface polysaccharide O-acyltransferase-like enzyme
VGAVQSAVDRRGWKKVNERIKSINSLKIIAVFAVVVAHTFKTDGHYLLLQGIVNQLCRFSVPFFFILSGYFFAKRLKVGENPYALLSRYAKRIGRIYLIWALIYFIFPSFAVIKAIGAAAYYKEKFIILFSDWETLLFVGPGGHLWFLVSLLLGLGLVCLCRPDKGHTKIVIVSLCLYVFGVIAGSYAGTPIGVQIAFNTRNAIFYSTAFLAIGSFFATMTFTPSLNLALGLIASGVSLHFAEAFFLWEHFDVPITSHNYLFGTIFWGSGVFLLALAKPDFLAHRFFDKMGGLTLGIYVSHLIFLKAGILQRLVLPKLSLLILTPVIIFCLAAIFCALASRVKCLKTILF